jgi:hypothetical protein
MGVPHRTGTAPCRSQHPARMLTLPVLRRMTEGRERSGSKGHPSRCVTPRTQRKDFAMPESNALIRCHYRDSAGRRCRDMLASKAKGVATKAKRVAPRPEDRNFTAPAAPHSPNPFAFTNMRNSAAFPTAPTSCNRLFISNLRERVCFGHGPATLVESQTCVSRLQQPICSHKLAQYKGGGGAIPRYLPSSAEEWYFPPSPLVTRHLAPSHGHSTMCSPGAHSRPRRASRRPIHGYR